MGKPGHENTPTLLPAPTQRAPKQSRKEATRWANITRASRAHRCREPPLWRLHLAFHRIAAKTSPLLHARMGRAPAAAPRRARRQVAARHHGAQPQRHTVLAALFPREPADGWYGISHDPGSLERFLSGRLPECVWSGLRVARGARRSCAEHTGTRAHFVLRVAHRISHRRGGARRSLPQRRSHASPDQCGG